MADASTTRIVGACNKAAISAVLAVPPRVEPAAPEPGASEPGDQDAPSKSPITPSTTTMSAPMAALATSGAMAWAPQIQLSRL